MKKLKHQKQQHGLVVTCNNWIDQNIVTHSKDNHYITTDWSRLPIAFDTSAKYQVNQDLLTALFLRHNGVPKENIISWHNQPEQQDALKNICGQVHDSRQEMKNFRDIGNVAYSISNEMFLDKLNYDMPVDMIGPASYSTAPWFTMNGKASKWGKILRKLEEAGLYRIVHIPHHWFTQLTKDGNLEEAAVQSCLYQTKPGYTGEVEVVNLATNETYFAPQGGIYPKSKIGLDNFVSGKENDAIKSAGGETKGEVIADDDYLVVPVFNNGKVDPAIPSKYSIGLHTKTFVKVNKGDIIPNGRSVYKSIKDINKVLAVLHSDDFARSYQAVSMQKTWSNAYIRMLQIDA